VIVNLSKKVLEKLTRKAYRDAYVAEHVKTGVAYQVRAMRDERDMSQKELAALMDKPQSVVSRIEDPAYGKLSVQTLLEVAQAFDVALVVKFAGYGEFISNVKDISPKALNAESFDTDQFRAVEFSKFQTITFSPEEFIELDVVDGDASPFFNVSIPTPMPELLN
jgi:transcriptional regulator with XRE-family HTH domain